MHSVLLPNILPSTKQSTVDKLSFFIDTIKVLKPLKFFSLLREAEILFTFKIFDIVFPFAFLSKIVALLTGDYNLRGVTYNHILEFAVWKLIVSSKDKKSSSLNQISYFKVNL